MEIKDKTDVINKKTDIAQKGCHRKGRKGVRHHFETFLVFFFKKGVRKGVSGTLL